MNSHEADLLLSQISEKEQEARRVESELAAVAISIQETRNRKAQLQKDIQDLHRRETLLLHAISSDKNELIGLEQRDQMLSARIGKLRQYELRFAQQILTEKKIPSADAAEPFFYSFSSSTSHPNNNSNDEARANAPSDACRICSAVAASFVFLQTAQISSGTNSSSSSSSAALAKLSNRAFYRTLGKLSADIIIKEGEDAATTI